MKIKRIIIGALVTVYLIVAVFLTACLLAYNDYNISVFGDKSFIIVKNDDFEPDYKKGTLLIVTKNKNDDIKVNDDIFFYNKYKNQITVSHSKVTKTEKLSNIETTYTVIGEDNDDYYVSSENVIGKADTTKVINNVGSVLGLLESRWGFLFIIVLPISVLFIYEIYIIVKEIVRPETDEEEEKIEEKPKKEDNDSEKTEPEEKQEEPKSEPVIEEKQEESKPEPVAEVKEEKPESDDELDESEE